MLIYLRVLPSNESLPLDVDPFGPCSQIIRFLSNQLPEFQVRRLLYAGKVIALEDVLSDYDLQKECVVQVMCQKIDRSAPPPASPSASPSASPAQPSLSSPPLEMASLSRLRTVPEVAYGDVLLIKEIEVVDLEEADYWTASCNPYVVLAFAQQQSRTSVKDKVLNARWNELLGFIVGAPGDDANAPWRATSNESSDAGSEVEEVKEATSNSNSNNNNSKAGKGKASKETAAASSSPTSPSAPLARPKETPDYSLCAMVFHHSLKNEDRMLGYFDIDLRTVQRDASVKISGDLKNGSGSITFTLERYALSSPQLRDILISMVRKERSFSSRMFRQHGVSLAHFTGAVPFIPLDKRRLDPQASASSTSTADTAVLPRVSAPSNPALTHLAQMIRSRTLSALHARGLRTLNKIVNILWTQKAVYTKDLPSRTVVITNLPLDEPDRANQLFVMLSEASDSQLKSLEVFPSLPLPLSLEAKSEKECKIGSGGSSSAVAVFKSYEAAVLALISLQNTELGGQRLRLTFGDSKIFDPASPSPSFPTAGSLAGLSQGPVLRANLMRVAFNQLDSHSTHAPSAKPKPKNKKASKKKEEEEEEKDKQDAAAAVNTSEPNLHLIVLTADHSLHFYSPFTHPAAKSINLKKYSIFRKGPGSLEIRPNSPKLTESYVIQCLPEDVDDMEAWRQLLLAGSQGNFAKGKKVETPKSKSTRKQSVSYVEEQMRNSSAEDIRLCSEWVKRRTAAFDGEFRCSNCNGSFPLQHLYITDMQADPVAFVSGDAALTVTSQHVDPTLPAPSSLHDPLTAQLPAPLSSSDLPLEDFKAFSLPPLSSLSLSTPLPLSPSPSADPLAPLSLATPLPSSSTSTSSSSSSIDHTSVSVGMSADPSDSLAIPNSFVQQWDSLDQPLLKRTSTVAQKGATCRTCLRSHIRQVKAQRGVHATLESYSLQDLKDLLDRPEFNDWSYQLTTMRLASDKKHFRHCPNPKCNLPFEIGEHNQESQSHNLTNDMGLDKRPFSADAQKHFLESRFRCRSCLTIFCVECGQLGYHNGFTCDEYKAWLVSPKCRFCSIGVLDRTRMKNPVSPALRDVCNSSSCQAKARLACTKFASCGVDGHVCLGIYDEKECMPCLEDHPDCSQKREAAGVASVSSDICVICGDEELKSAPCVRLSSCAHVFHHACLVRRLTQRWAGFRINLRFCRCPLCDVWIEHWDPQVTQLMEPMIALKSALIADVKNRVEADGLEKDPHVTNPDSVYYNKPLEYALDVYAYYTCNVCRKPYYGGRRECEANGAEEKANPDEFCCFQCAGGRMEGTSCTVPSHQEYIVWKCRFCCEPAIWFCFGSTHFCEYCHSHDPWGRANGTAADLAERAQCPPPGKTKCPLGLPKNKHSNGKDVSNELMLYCGMCRNEKHATLVQSARVKVAVPLTSFDVVDEKKGDGRDAADDDVRIAPNCAFPGCGRHASPLCISSMCSDHCSEMKCPRHEGRQQ